MPLATARCNRKNVTMFWRYCFTSAVTVAASPRAVKFCMSWLSSEWAESYVFRDMALTLGPRIGSRFWLNTSRTTDLRTTDESEA